MGRIQREKKIIKLMINIYCRKKHKSKKNEFCDECIKYLEKKLNTLIINHLN